ncbi:MAG: MBL fold metallo-hydrolase [Clostridia bacterium]|nr:MBL fold metallo-hydrolase [Clostridia bacterium]
MELLFAPLFSGSSGNSIYVGTEDEAVIVDAGVSASAIISEMGRAGLSPASVKALLVTHEHTDHINGAGALARKLGVPVYATEGTWEGMSRRAGKLADSQKVRIERGSDFYIGRINVLPFPIPHDCRMPCGYTFAIGNVKVSVATDIGCIKAGWTDAVTGSDLVLLESNYDPDMLMAGPYPYELKQRILGRRGHLSNEDAGAAAVLLVNTGTRALILGHLSKENNFPELALETSRGVLAENDIRAGQDVYLSYARREGLSGVYRVSDTLGVERVI